MRLMKASEYGIHGVLYLALQPKGKITVLDEVAEAENIPKSYLSKIFQIYTKVGILKSYRGANKGFILAKPPQKITLKELIESFEGKFSADKCLLGRRNCANTGKCPVSLKWQEAVEAMSKVLEKTTLKQLMDSFDYNLNAA
ncbi:MAG: hypothetical protein A2W05_08670 [Candidatus Schekmanbacteria bacterium RBG_16_38_10]|uniref:Rrf2 family transcriptional regulator n=1 Tax=Candidatus Schekmanbacteria bacterium RBG_16_38_10 TaxID=1817879 RepID=A0A1F7RWS7_9BACT|nr:MAG: hypothetical protein A2W05_08670 [Candidatus Schekmanbacteria bacterium RBG_16_38_10]